MSFNLISEQCTVTHLVTSILRIQTRNSCRHKFIKPLWLCLSLIGLTTIACQGLVAQEQSDTRRDKNASNGVARIHERDFIHERKSPASQEPSIQRLSLAPEKKEKKEKVKDTPSPSDPGTVVAEKTSLLPAAAERRESKVKAETESMEDTLPPIESNQFDIEIQDGRKDAESDANDTLPTNAQSAWSFQNMTDRKTLPSTIQMFVSIAAISLVPAILLMTTCFIRIVVVLGILRQAIGLQQLPPTQVTTALALMMTFLIMAPTWKKVKQDAIDPYSAEGSTMTWDDAWNSGITPIKRFMWSQISRAENEKDFWVFYDYLPEEERSKEPQSYQEVPLKVLLPAFMISELKVAFLIGIQVLLPFLILDIVVASLCNTMGLIMLPPTVVSLPLKLLLFVMVDGWNLVVAMLLDSFSAL